MEVSSSLRNLNCETMFSKLGFLSILGVLLLPSSIANYTFHGELESLLMEEPSPSSSSCSLVYKQGGAPAVFQSPKCPQWTLSTEAKAATTAIRKPTETNCQAYILQGRRRYQEDRAFCELDLQVPFPGKTGVEEVKVGMVAVFDGHNGAEASEMASKLILKYFLLHVHFLRHGIYSIALKGSMGKFLHKGEQDSLYDVLNRIGGSTEHGLDLVRVEWIFPEIFDVSFHMEILKESLLRAIHDINATFTEEAIRKNITSGSTATVVLIVDNQILVSNVGDSKAILCSEKFQSPQEIKETLLKYRSQRRRNRDSSSAKRYQKPKVTSSDGMKHYFAKELTRDHHPDRDDERSRVESAGGYVEEWAGVPRVNGQLAVSRSIGDVFFKRYGVISLPEVTDWQPLASNDTYLVAASDGIFERMSTQDVCDILWDVHTLRKEKLKDFSSCKYSLAKCIVSIAFENGSMDNMAAVVVPLKAIDIYGSVYNNNM